MDSNLLNLTLLYVEDDNDTRVRLTEVFKHKVANLYIARDGLEALKLFKKHQIHFIISDFQMPKINGNELCSMVKEINPSICFILLTAYNDSDLLINAIDSGVDKFLQKPVDAKKIFSLIDEIGEKIMNKFQLEKSIVCLRETEKIAKLSYWDINLKTGVISFSKEAIKLFNISNDTEANVDYKIFSTIVKEKERTKFLEIFERRVYEEDKIDEVIVIQNSMDKEIYIHIVAKRWKSSACGTRHVIGLFQDVTHYELQKIKLLKESLSDPVLNIANKKLLVLELENLIKASKRYNCPIGVIFFDIDNFKYINDEYGHLVADNLLVELSNLIKCNIRQSDYFGRWGGDDVNTLLNRADLKMFEAKKSGKNRYYY